MKWKDKQEVMMLSTFHDDTFIEKRWRTHLASDDVEMVKKPVVVEEYNQHMGGVDKGKKVVFISVPGIYKKTYQVYDFS